ncbi:unnamed protein product [Pleuronectes platessa]|uniref:Uncharacterized protein n=1 Tax=Pleuronectes platessa TaxID=8262 RepID=A0A9N7VZP1_PLEPL|nr:unnamed protein product [Pleuronectes platessa]
MDTLECGDRTTDLHSSNTSNISYLTSICLIIVQMLSGMSRNRMNVIAVLMAVGVGGRLFPHLSAWPGPRRDGLELQSLTEQPRQTICHRHTAQLLSLLRALLARRAPLAKLFKCTASFLALNRISSGAVVKSETTKYTMSKRGFVLRLRLFPPPSPQDATVKRPKWSREKGAGFLTFSPRLLGVLPPVQLIAGSCR